jgi:hypothetical protein
MPAHMSSRCGRVIDGYDVASLCHRCRSQHSHPDELGKRIHLQAASIAFVATVILNYVFFGLQTARICALKATDPLSKKRDEAIRTTRLYCRQAGVRPVKLLKMIVWRGGTRSDRASHRT